LGLDPSRTYRPVRAVFQFGNSGSNAFAQLAITDPSSDSTQALIAVGQAKYALNTAVTAAVINSASNSYHSYGTSDVALEIYYGAAAANPPGILRMWFDVGQQVI
jgi:hypothetical protein